MINLTFEQEVVKTAIQAIIGSEDTVCVSGAGGVGKTFSIARAVESHKALFLTPTHAAKEVLKNELPNDTQHIVKTIHSGVGWGMKETFHGVEEWCTGPEKTRQDELWKSVDILIVDEASMVSKHLFTYLKLYAEHYKLPVVWSGDASQLPSVNSSSFSVFSEGYPLFTLHKTMRFAEDSGIATVCKTMRKKIADNNTRPFIIPDKEEWSDVEFLPKDEWLATIKAAYERNDDAVAIAFDHKSLAELREGITGFSHKCLKGQLLRCLKTSPKFKNGETFTVKEAKELETKVFPIEWKKVYSARPAWLSKDEWKSDEVHLVYQTIMLDNDKTATVIASDDTVTKVKNLTRKLRGSSKSLSFPKTEEFDLHFLSTVHSSQGSSFETVYIHTPSVLVRVGLYQQREKANEWLRLVYVGLSRARKKLVLMNYPDENNSSK